MAGIWQTADGRRLTARPCQGMNPSERVVAHLPAMVPIPFPQFLSSGHDAPILRFLIHRLP